MITHKQQLKDKTCFLKWAFDSKYNENVACTVIFSCNWNKKMRKYNIVKSYKNVNKINTGLY